MTKDDAKLDELRKSAAKVIVGLYTSARTLEATIDVAPDLAALRESPAMDESRQMLDRVRRWLLAGALDDRERGVVKEGTPERKKEQC